MPKKKLIETFSLQDLSSIAMIGGTLVTDIIAGNISENARQKYLRAFNFTGLMRGKPSTIDKIYPDQYPEIKQYLYGDKDFKLPPAKKTETENEKQKRVEYNKELDDEIFEKNYELFNIDTTEPDHIFYGNTLKGYGLSSQFYTNELLEQPIKDMTKALKGLSKDIDKYLDQEILSNDEIEFINGFKSLVDIWASGNSVDAKKKENPVYDWMMFTLTCAIKFNTINLLADRDLDTGEVDVKTAGLNRIIDWKDVMLRLYSGNVTPAFLSAYRVTRGFDKYNAGDMNRDDLLKAYEEYATEMEKVLSMTEKEYDSIKKDMGTGYRDIAGGRAYSHVLDDTRARIDLIKSGYPVSDFSTMTQFYMLMKGYERLSADAKEPDQFIVARTGNMAKLWAKATGYKHLDDKARSKVLNEMSEMVALITPDDAAKISAKVGMLAAQLKSRAEAKLDISEMTELAASSKALYKVIDKVDPMYISSSEQFKQMKDALEILAEIDKTKDPAGYELWRERATMRTQLYLDYKHKELNNPKSSHKRSADELKRVKAARGVLNRLKTIKKMDIEEKLASDPRIVANDKMDYQKGGKDFVIAQVVLYKALGKIEKELKDIKAILISTQDDPDANFGGENKEGSKEYRAMTEALEKSIIACDGDHKPNDVYDAVEAFQKAAINYHDAKKGIVFNSLSTKGDLRFKQSGDVERFSSMLKVYDNARRQFENYRDENGMSFMSKPYNEIDDISASLVERYEKKEFKEDVFNSAFDPDGRYNYLEAIVPEQDKVSAKIIKGNDFMIRNYASDRSADYYMAVKKSQSVSELAKNYTVKKYLDKVYNKDVTLKDLSDLNKQVDKGIVAKESEALAKNVVFKAIAKKYPTRVFSEWDKLSKAADKIQGMCGDNLLSTHRSNKKDGVTTKDNSTFNNEDDFIASFLEADKAARATAYVMVNKMMSDPTGKMGRIIAESLAADTTADPELEIMKLVDVGTKIINQTRNKNHRDMTEMKNDPKFIKSFNTKMLESFKTEVNNKATKAKQAKKNKSKDVDLNGVGPLMP